MASTAGPLPLLLVVVLLAPGASAHLLPSTYGLHASSGAAGDVRRVRHLQQEDTGSVPSSLAAGGQLLPGQRLRSPNGNFSLVYQPDGNLCVYQGEEVPRMVWQSNSDGKPAGSANLTETGQLLLCSGSNADSCYRTYGSGRGDPGAYQLVMADSGDVTVVNAGGAVVFYVSHYYCPDLAGYIKLQDRDHPGDDMGPRTGGHGAQGLQNYLKQQCDADCKCAGFTSGGWMKYAVVSLSLWPSTVWDEQCLYKKDVNSSSAASCKNGPPAPPSPAVRPSVSLGSVLSAGQKLYPGQRLESESQQFALVYRPEGNLALYEGRQPPRAVWQSETWDKPAGYVTVDQLGYLTICSSATSCYFSKGSKTPKPGTYQLHVLDTGDMQIVEATTKAVAYTFPYFCPEVAGYERLQYQDHLGDSYFQFEEPVPTVLATACSSDCRCAGFTSNGYLKTNLSFPTWPDVIESADTCLYRRMDLSACGRPNVPMAPPAAPPPAPPALPAPPAPPPAPAPIYTSTATFVYGLLSGTALDRDAQLQASFLQQLHAAMADYFSVNTSQVVFSNVQFVARQQRRQLRQQAPRSAVQLDAAVTAPQPVLAQRLPPLLANPAILLPQSMLDDFQVPQGPGDVAATLVEIQPPLPTPLPPAPPMPAGGALPAPPQPAPDTPPAVAAAPAADSGGGSGPNVGLIAGVVVVVAVVALAGLLVAVWCVRKRRRRRPKTAAVDAYRPVDEPKHTFSEALPRNALVTDLGPSRGSTQQGEGLSMRPSLMTPLTMTASGGVRSDPRSPLLGSPRPATAVLPPLAGLIRGDPFLRGTAQQYTWSDYSPGPASVCVEAGLTDTQLDSWALPAATSGAGTGAAGGQGAGRVCPAVRLTSAQVAQQVELLQDGLLGRGGAALVFTGRWPARFGRNGLVAVKVLKDAYDAPPLIVQSFVYEARVLASVQHDNIVRMYGYCLELPTICIIMELCAQPLERLLHPQLPAPGQPSTGLGLPHPPATSAHASAGSLPHASPSAVTSSPPGTSFHTNSPQALASATSSSSELRGIHSPAGFRHHSPSYTTNSPALAHAHPHAQLYSGTAHAPHSSSSLASSVGAGALRPQPSVQPSVLSVQQVLSIAADVAAGLAYLHDRHVAVPLEATPGAGGAMAPADMQVVLQLLQAGEAGGDGKAHIVHRDLKPGNILINSQGRAKISDFGLAREHHATTVHTVHVGAGTIAYMSPELLMGRRAASGHFAPKPTNRVDVYSLGIMMWEMVARKRPFEGMHEVELLAAVCSKVRPSIPTTSNTSPAKQQPRGNSSASLQRAGSSALSATSSVELDAGLPSSSGGAGAERAGGEMGGAGWAQQAASWDTVPPGFVELIRACWRHRDLKRPTAAQVHDTLSKLLRSAGGAGLGAPGIISGGALPGFNSGTIASAAGSRGPSTGPSTRG